MVPTPILASAAPWFCAGVWASSYAYYTVHKKSHLEPEWARKHLSWHYDHHMGPNQHSNWCVTRPWFDHILGTREPYVGTDRERADTEKRADREARALARAAE